MSPSLSLAALFGCAPGAGSGVLAEGMNAEESPELGFLTDTVITDSEGLARLTFTAQALRSFLITAQTDGAAEGGEALWPYFDKLYAPDGQIVLDADEWQDIRGLTAATSATEGPEAILNWPVLEELPLDDGEYTAVLGVGYWNDVGEWEVAPDEVVDVTVHENRDDDPEQGVIRALVIFADGLGEDPLLRGAVLRAIGVWDEILAPVNLTVDLTFADSTISPDLHWPGYDYSELGVDVDQVTLAQASAMVADPEQLTIVIGEQYLNNEPDADEPYDLETLGMAGGIPGTIVPTWRTGLTVASLVASGGDGVFDEYDIRILGGTLAHEAGHYMGLFHPVEIGDVVGGYDGLPDTPECEGLSVAECEGVLGDNLMFPYTIEDLVQEDISEAQGFVLNHYTPVVSQAQEAQQDDDSDAQARRAVSSDAVSDIPDTELWTGELSDEARGLQRQLAHHDRPPSCSELAARDDVSELLREVAYGSRIGFVQMRAASCLLQLDPLAAADDAEQWMLRPDTKGFAILASQHLGGVLSVDAARLEEAALAGPHREDVLPRMELE